MPLEEYPELGKQWIKGQRSNPGLLPELLKKAGHGGAQNCPLPQNITGFVQGAPCNTLLTALRNGVLRADGVDHDHGLAGASYVYFRIMLAGETPGSMAFNSVGSSNAVRMEFSPRIWNNTRGGYICDHDGMGTINVTPFSQSAQADTFYKIIRLGRATRGSAEMAIYSSVSMADLVSAWVQFRYSLNQIKRYAASMAGTAQQPLPPQSTAGRRGPVIVRPVSTIRAQSKRTTVPQADEALRSEAALYREIKNYLPYEQERNKIPNTLYRWIRFYR